MKTCDEDDLSETVDELSNAFSSGIAPVDYLQLPPCCCEQEDCTNYQAWLDMKLRLENKLTLTVDIGHALVQRHEELYQRHEELYQRHEELYQESGSKIEESDSSRMEEDHTRISELIEENQVLEKRLNQALLNSEVNEISSENLLRDLQDARQTVTRLTAENTSYASLESSLLKVTNERDDLLQERGVESAKAKRTEQELTSLQVKNSKLHSEVQQLRDELKQRNLYQKEFKGSLLQSAKSQIQKLYAKLSLTTALESTALTKSLEDACAHNEELKQYVRELEHFLVDARDEILALRQDTEQQELRVETRPYTHNNEFRGIFKEDALDVNVKIASGSDSKIRRTPQQSLTILLCDVLSKFFFLVGILSYWFFCAKVTWIAMLKEDQWPGIIGYLLSTTIPFVVVCRVAKKQPRQSLYEATLVNITSFMGASVCVFVGWRIVYEIRTVLALSYINGLIPSIIGM
ncbi:hypothetical protein FB446DRAFT_790424 [Lentinula raphanica]|nr:hypothetical protein FB446DRAFT_790424 [Lentinula raphanica]